MSDIKILKIHNNTTPLNIKNVINNKILYIHRDIPGALIGRPMLGPILQREAFTQQNTWDWWEGDFWWTCQVWIRPSMVFSKETNDG